MEDRFTTRLLDARTWPDFAALVEASNGVWGGCSERERRRILKRRRQEAAAALAAR